MVQSQLMRKVAEVADDCGAVSEVRQSQACQKRSRIHRNRNITVRSVGVTAHLTPKLPNAKTNVDWWSSCIRNGFLSVGLRALPASVGPP